MPRSVLLSIASLSLASALAGCRGAPASRPPRPAVSARATPRDDARSPARGAPAGPAGCPFGLEVTRGRDEPGAVPTTPRELTAAFAGAMELSDVRRLRRPDGLEVAAATFWRGQQQAEIALVWRRGEGPYTAPRLIDASPLLDHEPELAWTGDGERVAVLWARGPYPFAPDLHLAIAEPDRVVSSSVLARGARPEGHTLAATRTGLVVAYTPSSVLGASQRGLYVVTTDRDGSVRSRQRVLSGPALWPLAATTGDGGSVGVTYRLDREGLGFVLVAGDGSVRTGPRVIDRDDDPAAGFRALAIAERDGLFWIGAIASFHVSVIVAAPTQARVVAVDSRGRATPAATVSGATHAELASLVPAGDARGADASYHDREGRHDVRVTCRATAPAPAEHGAGPCDARTERWRRGRFGPLRGLFAASGLADGGWAVAYRPLVQEDGYRRADDTARVARLRADGVELWDVELGDGAGRPGLVATRRALAVTWERDDHAHLTLLDADTGAERGTHRLEHGSSRTANACVAPSAGGWLVAFAQEGPSQIVWLAPDGHVEPRAALRDRWNGCALAPTSDGFAMAITVAPRVSESNWIYTLGLDSRGAPRADPVRIAGEGFARTPVLVSRGPGALLVWTGPVERELVAQALDSHGATTGPFRELARTYGMWGFGVGDGSDGVQLLWASERGGVGRRRVCDEGATPGPP